MESPVSENFKREAGSESDDINNKEKEATDNHLAHAVNLVASNYIIVRQIMQNLSWRDVKMASSVSKLWNKAAANLRASDLTPQYFCFIYQRRDRFMNYKIDKESINEPMLILAFWEHTNMFKEQKMLNKRNMFKEFESKYYQDHEYNNSFEPQMLMHYAYMKLSYPSNAFVGVLCDKVIYPFVKLELSDSIEEEFMAGIYFPRIKGVRIHNLRQRIEIDAASNEISSISDNLSKIMETQHIKCLLIFLCDRFESSHEHIITTVISEVITRQGKEYPFAVGGCEVYGTHIGNFHKPTDLRTLNVIAIGVDKKISDSSFKLDVFSKVIARRDDSDDRIAENVAEMSKSIPRRKYSAAVKLSCIRRLISDNEDTVFTTHFPETKAVGCHGRKQIALEFLPRKVFSDDTKVKDTNARMDKKPRIDIFQKHELFYEDSSVMVLFSWDDHSSAVKGNGALKRPTVNKTAIPSIFNNLPAYLIKITVRRKDSQVRRDAMEEKLGTAK